MKKWWRYLGMILGILCFSCSDQLEHAIPIDDSAGNPGEVEIPDTSLTPNPDTASPVTPTDTVVIPTDTVVTPTKRIGPVSQYGQLQSGVNSAGAGRIYGSCPAYAQSGSEVQVRGMSLYWSLNDYGTRFYNREIVTGLVENMHIEVIRLAIGVDQDWGNGNYFTDPEYYQALIDSVITAAIDLDIYAIIDYHSHAAHEDVASSQQFFLQQAYRWGSYDNVIFELYNEPTTATWTQIKSYADQVIPYIRAYSDNLILVGNPNWDQKPNVAINNPIVDANVAYTFHYYAGTHSVSSQGKNAERAMSAGLSVFVSEWGTINADGDGSVAASNTTWQNWLDTYKLSSANWSVSDLSEGASIFTTAGPWNYSESGLWVLNNVFSRNPTSYTACGAL